MSLPIYAVVCPTLIKPANGEVVVTTDGTISYGSFMCDLHYSLKGQYNIACGKDGKWETEAPECGL